MRLPVMLVAILTGTAVRAETVVDFVSACNNSELAACFERISNEIDTLKSAEGGKTFCLPRAWGATMFESVGYPVSVLEHVRLGMSASRFGGSEQPANSAMSAILAKTFPCRDQ